MLRGEELKCSVRYERREGGEVETVSCPVPFTIDSEERSLCAETRCGVDYSLITFMYNLSYSASFGC